jgi:uncharacterized protein YkwD
VAMSVRSRVGIGVAVIGIAGIAAAGVLKEGANSDRSAELAAVRASQSADVPTGPSSVPAWQPPVLAHGALKPAARVAPSPSKTARPKASARSKTPARKSAPLTGSAERQVLARINQARAAAGAAPLTMSTPLVASAHAHNLVMSGGCGLSHQCSGEAGLGDRITAQGVRWTAVAENIGDGGPVSATESGQASMAVRLTDSMLAEVPPDDGHRKNILNPALHHIGIDVIRDSSGTVWMTQDFSN